MALKYSSEDHVRWIEAVNTDGSGLTDWETSFMKSITFWVVDQGGTLTDKQEQTLERIYANKVS